MSDTIEPINGQQENPTPEEIRFQKLARLRAEFDANHISKKPVPTKAQTEAVKANYQVGIRCPICKGWHHPQVEHLDYVGHAALTDRLLDVDPEWNWEPMAIDAAGLPMIKDGGMWIRLTVCGMTRLGYGSADGKTGGDAVKEIIGDALRNAGMRFGAALDLWHKGVLHMDDETGAPRRKEKLTGTTAGAFNSLDPETQKKVLDAANTIKLYLADGKEWDAYDKCESFCKDDMDLKTALWACLDSKVRRKIKELGVQARLDKKAMTGSAGSLEAAAAELRATTSGNALESTLAKIKACTSTDDLDLIADEVRFIDNADYQKQLYEAVKQHRTKIESE